MASLFHYILVMPTNNKEKNDNFYNLFKEMLENQSKILKNQDYIMSSLDRMQGEKPKPSDEAWRSI